MKILVVYNHGSGRALSRLGTQNKEKYELDAIDDLLAALSELGHDAHAAEGDIDLLRKLEELNAQAESENQKFMVFNLAYGVQGVARYTHVPGLLEMAGIPYVGSGPLAHGLCLDKVVAKLLFEQHALPTPRFLLMQYGDEIFPLTKMPLSYPLVVKPRAEAASLGLHFAQNETELKEAVLDVFAQYQSDALVEEYIEGQEINVGVIGNRTPFALPPVEIKFNWQGPHLYTYEDKKGLSQRSIESVCPAEISPALTQAAQDLALRVFRSVGCSDCARIDLRLDSAGQLFVLEINSLPSLRRDASFARAALAAGIEFPALIELLLASASARYFPGDATLHAAGKNGLQVSQSAGAFQILM